jgi:hypothetical protein
MVAFFFLGVVANIFDLGHSKSWQYGHDHSGDAATMTKLAVSEDSACRSIAGLGTDFDSKLDYNDIMDGCLAGLRGG